MSSELYWEISFSDNSHIMGIPFVVQEGYDATMVIPTRDMKLLREIAERTGVLRLARISLHINYAEEVKRD